MEVFSFLTVSNQVRNILVGQVAPPKSQKRCVSQRSCNKWAAFYQPSIPRGVAKPSPSSRRAVAEQPPSGAKTHTDRPPPGNKVYDDSLQSEVHGNLEHCLDQFEYIWNTV